MKPRNWHHTRVAVVWTFFATTTMQHFKAASIPPKAGREGTIQRQSIMRIVDGS